MAGKDSKIYKYVDLSGYGFTGKHAVIDLLREFRGYHVPHFTFEVCLLRIQGGILDLEDALCNDWSPIRSDAAIRRFKRLIRRLGTKNVLYDPRTWFSAAGWNYDEYFNHRFIELSSQYVERLVNASWVTDWPYPKVDLCDLELFVRKVKKKLGFKNAYDFGVYLSFPSDFVSITRDYLNELLSSNVGDDVKKIVLHNSFEPFQPQRCLKYFQWAKCIIVDRDPRDNYVQQFSYRAMAVGLRDFIMRYRIYREATKKFLANDKNILRLRFEDLIWDYDGAVARIREHLEEDESVHVRPRRYFNPDVSKKNVGIWKEYEKQDEIEVIYRELRGYCFE